MAVELKNGACKFLQSAEKTSREFAEAFALTIGGWAQSVRWDEAAGFPTESYKIAPTINVLKAQRKGSQP